MSRGEPGQEQNCESETNRGQRQTRHVSAVAHLSERTLGYVEKIAAAIIKAKRRMFKLVHKNRGGSLFVRILSDGELEPLLFDNLTQRERSLTVDEALGAFLHTPPPRAEKKESKKERTKKRKRR